MFLLLCLSLIIILSQAFWFPRWYLTSLVPRAQRLLLTRGEVSPWNHQLTQQLGGVRAARPQPPARIAEQPTPLLEPCPPQQHWEEGPPQPGGMGGASGTMDLKSTQPHKEAAHRMGDICCKPRMGLGLVPTIEKELKQLNRKIK